MTRDEEKEPFAYGDRTIFQLRAQSFEPDEDYGTMILPVSALPAVETIAEPEPSADPITRIEQKLDQALRLLNVLQHKIDSIDATLARVLNR